MVLCARLSILLCLLITVAGCSSNASQSQGHSVSGTVTANGGTVAHGLIFFGELDTPEGNQNRSASATITDGKYSIPEEDGPAAGMNSVAVQVFRQAPPGGEVSKEFEATADIPEGGSESLDFSF